jgi:hypothetical protein
MTLSCDAPIRLLTSVLVAIDRESSFEIGIMKHPDINVVVNKTKHMDRARGDRKILPTNLVFMFSAL